MISFDRKSWVKGSESTQFPIQNLPYSIYSTATKSKRMGVAIGDKIIDLTALVDLQYLVLPREITNNDYINDFMALGKEKTNKIRLNLADLLDENNTELANHPRKNEFLDDMNSARLHMPVYVRDYTDFYSSRAHATNVGKLFRDPENALLPNWLHLPVGYHGRASSIVVSGTDFLRPKGQMKPADAPNPVYGPTKLLDFELEVAFVINQSTALGESVTTDKAEDYIFGLTLFNDLSARDIQAWEYVPLGPFLGKNFCSVTSPWVVPLEAFEEFRLEGETQDPQVLPYLAFTGKKFYDIKLEVGIQPQGGEETVICKSNFKYMYWNMCQQLAHHTVNGCNLNTGDMMASGTISGWEKSEFGSMLELTWRGTEPITLKDGSTRKFLNDFDTCIMRGFAEKNGIKIGFGDCITTVLPAS